MATKSRMSHGKPEPPRLRISESIYCRRGGRPCRNGQNNPIWASVPAGSLEEDQIRRTGMRKTMFIISAAVIIAAVTVGRPLPIKALTCPETVPVSADNLINIKDFGATLLQSLPYRGPRWQLGLHCLCRRESEIF